MKIRKYLLPFWIIIGAFFLVLGIVPEKNGTWTRTEYVAIFISAIFFLLAFYNYKKFWKKKINTSGVVKPFPIQNLSDEEKAVLSSLSDGPDKAIETLKILPSISTAPDMKEAIKTTIINSIPILTDKILEDGIFSDDEEKAVTGLFTAAGISYNDISPQKKEQLIKAALLRDLLNGTIQQRMNVPDLPFNLQKSEMLIWAWPNVDVRQNKTVSEWQAGNHGVSVRIAKGVYYRFGATKGQRVSKDIQENLGSGPFIVTNKHIYYRGNAQAKRIRLDKIISTDIYSDGVIIYTDGTNSKPLVIMSNDSWFMGNCINNAQNWA